MKSINSFNPSLTKTFTRKLFLSQQRPGETIEVPAPSTSFLLQADNSSFILQADGSSKILKAQDSP